MANAKMGAAQTRPQEDLITNDCLDLIAHSKFYRKMVGPEVPSFTRTQFKWMVSLISVLDDANVVRIERDSLCRLLDTSNKNLNRKLRSLSHLVRSYTSWDDTNIPAGCVMLVIHPGYGWKESDSITREEAIKQWFLTEDHQEAIKHDFWLWHEKTQVQLILLSCNRTTLSGIRVASCRTDSPAKP